MFKNSRHGFTCAFTVGPFLLDFFFYILCVLHVFRGLYIYTIDYKFYVELFYGNSFMNVPNKCRVWDSQSVQVDMKPEKMDP